jgi:tRNA(adenine34) deaminase
MKNLSDEQFMRVALNEAELASAEDEVPVGAIAVVDGEIVGHAHNIREKTANPLGHAEILLLENLARQSHDWRFEDVTVYVTCEPCIMCAGALLQARVSRIVYGCKDPKAGACDSLYELTRDTRLNHQIETIGGVLADECGRIMSEFFKKKRET